MTPGFDCQGCGYTQTEPSLEAAMDHALQTGHQLVHVIDDEGTVATVSLAPEYPDWDTEADAPDPRPWILSPDCRDGNCSKCNGDAWDLMKDMPTSCTCHHHADAGDALPGL